MWEAITTISEIDTVKQGTLLAKENPDENIDTEIYRVTGRTDENISINPRVGNHFVEDMLIKADDLFDEGWWMLKEN